ncbi:MAG: hypothetical protein KQ78_01559 [Candidatus Izimaplasma bacterium HR2]|nr:MAG: hypothetical protein KQ78_01559 [Candidatus Izimaplasma bacterium HR2]
MESQNKNKSKSFEEEKIKLLNKFFMKNVVFGALFMLIMFSVTVILLLLIIKTTSVDETLKISLISMVVTFIITTSKSIIEKSITIVSYLIRLLSEEQRGLSGNLGIEIDKIELEEIEQNG